MCGIAGVVGDLRGGEGRARTEAMIRSLRRRGPDGEGFECWDEASLGHRRLAIFDLSDQGRQPMMSPDHNIGVVFNGAIYNFRQLRLELEAEGYEFKSHSDTEVLIHGYAWWGIDALVARIRGMFAFALWDERARKIFLVRDRLGVKPLVYCVRNEQLAFASTVRALRHGGFVCEIDDSALTEYLEFGFVTDQRAIYRGAVKVPAATIVEWSGGKLTTKCYWEPPAVSISKSSPSFEESVEEVEQLFLAAVKKRLFADVPVGALLSGGIDSSLVCWAISHLGGDVTAFTVGTPGDPEDETKDAIATASRLGVRHRVLNLDVGEEPDVSELVTAYAEPFACSSALGMLRVSRSVASEATVLLTGDGGDDVFLGYDEHRHLWMAEKAASVSPDWVSRAWMASRGPVPRYGVLKRAASFLDYMSGGLGAVTCTHDGLPMYQKNGILGTRIEGASIIQRDIPWSRNSGKNVLSEFLQYDRSTRFVGEYMTKVDGATMHYGLEARAPFLDQELWEFAAALPYDLRLRRGSLKALLRELAARKLGAQVARGRKRGFSIPVQRWLAGPWRKALEHLLHDSLLEREGWINSGPILAVLEKSARSGWVPSQLWYIFVLESWLRHERADSRSLAIGCAEKITAS